MSLRITKQDEGHTFYGHGKLLITGEYFVLDGALALSVPTKFGQSLRYKELNSTDNILYWIALDNQNKPWLQFTFDKENFACLNASENEAKDLTGILNAARELNPNFLTVSNSVAVETRLEFPRNWGLGSSSTLIYCVASWAGVDGYTLLQKSLKGSGYDVANAGHDSAILYQLNESGGVKAPTVTPVNWKPVFSDNLYFAHLGKKQSSPQGIKNYRELVSDKTHGVNELTRITHAVLKCTELNVFEELMNEHEILVGSQLKQLKVKDALFSDYWGSVKSLGAWGGDFVMLTNNKSEAELKEYLAAKNIDTVFKWNEIIFEN